MFFTDLLKAASSAIGFLQQRFGVVWGVEGTRMEDDRDIRTWEARGDSGLQLAGGQYETIEWHSSLRKTTLSKKVLYNCVWGFGGFLIFLLLLLIPTFFPLLFGE